MFYTEDENGIQTPVQEDGYKLSFKVQDYYSGLPIDLKKLVEKSMMVKSNKNIKLIRT